MASNLVLWLEAQPNPDFRPGSHGRELSIAPIAVPIEDLEEASAKVRAFIDRFQVGGGNFVGQAGQVTRLGAPYAYVSYNGRIWQVARNWQRTGIELDGKGNQTKNLPNSDLLKRGDFTRIPALIPEAELLARVLEALSEDEEVELLQLSEREGRIAIFKNKQLILAQNGELQWGQWLGWYGQLEKPGEMGPVYVWPSGYLSYEPPPSPYPPRLKTKSKNVLSGTNGGWLPEPEEAALMSVLDTRSRARGLAAGSYYRQIKGGWLVILVKTANGQRIASVHRFDQATGTVALRFLNHSQYAWSHATKKHKLLGMTLVPISQVKLADALNALDDDGDLLLR